MADENTNIQGDETNLPTEDKSNYSAEEVQKLLQSEVDRRITSAQKKWEKESKLKLSEAEKLARMTEEQRHAAELESKIKELEERDRQLAIRENKIEAMKIMDSKGIPSYMVDMIVSADADEMDSRIKLMDRWQKELKTIFAKEVQKGTTPQSGSTSAKPTKEQFQKMNLAQKTQIFKTNPDLWKELNS